MRIRGWTVEGFGALHDLVVSDLPDGLTVFHGPNEAGKTSLKEFLRRMLFGISSNGGPPAYSPQYGGRHAGSVRVASAAGEFVIERMLDHPSPANVTRPDGARGDLADLEILLGGADARLFTAVYSCGLDDLVALTAGDAGAVRERLFSASLAVAGRSARAAVRSLRTQAVERLSGEGQARINGLIAELEALRPRLNAARRAAFEVSERRHAATRAAAAVAPLRAALAARQTRRERDAALLAARPAWNELHTLRAAAAALPADVAAPSDLDAQLAAARERLRAAEAAVRDLAAERAETERREQARQADSAARTVAELAALRADLALHRYQLATLPAARARAEEAEQSRRERLRRLGPEWTSARLQEWARAGIDRDAVRDWQSRLRGAAERVEQARWRVDAAVAQRATLARDAAPAIPADLPTAEEIERRLRGLAGLRAQYAEMLERRGRGEATAQALHDRERALRGVEAEATPAPPGWLAPGLWAGAAFAAVGAVGATLTEQGQLAAVLVIAAAASGFGADRTRRVARWHADRESEREQMRRTLRSEVEALRRTRDGHWHRAAELAELVATSAVELGLKRNPTPVEIDAGERALAAQVAERDRHEAARARAAELEPLHRQAEADEAARRVDLEAAIAAERIAGAEWSAWASAAGFPPGCDPAAALERTGLVEAARAADSAADAAARELRQIEPLVAAWEARARALLGRLGDAAAAALGGEELVERVGTLTASEPRIVHGPTPEWEALQARLAVAATEATAAAEALQMLLQSAGVRDEAELAARRRRDEQRRGLERDIALRERLLAERLAWEQATDELAGDPIEWETRLAGADAELAALSRRCAQAEAEARRAEQACRALEDSAEVPGLELEWDGLMTELSSAVAEWRVLSAAEGLIEQARAGFEQARQPSVLREASRAFTNVTGGRYVRIGQDEQAEGLVVTARDGHVRRAGGELSRGTLEQLYLSLRLGLAADLARRGTVLPLVLDDVLVNFDPGRAAAMAQALGIFAREHQILFFTCHPSTRDMLIQAGAARVVEMGGEPL